MKILILGAGQVGGTLAAHLASEQFDITLVDETESSLMSLSERLDIQTVQGWASHPDVLARAGAQDADMLIAVTSSDEVNILACQVCATLFRTPTKIARIRAASYLDPAGFDAPRLLPIDVVINPEQVVTDGIERLLEHPGTLQVLDFADGRIQLVAVKAVDGGLLVGRALRLLREDMPNVESRVAAIYRRGKAIIPTGDTIIEAEDEVFFVAAREHINDVMSELRRVERPFRRVMIAGGGNIGTRLARAIENRFIVKVLERSTERCNLIADALSKAVVLNIDATDQERLLEENIVQCDVFCALTNDDEVNVMSSLLAKRLGVRQVITLISKPAYVDLVQGGEIDIAISPQQATASLLLSYVRHADVVRAHSLRRGAAEAIEAIAHGDFRSSRVVGRQLQEIPLPPGATIGAIARGDRVLIAHDDVVVEPEDHLIIFLVDKRQIAAVERLFQVDLNFF
ncbi:MAG: Trk system potassium transporter TrkA [Gammaproteobacteria bacterium]